MYFLTNQFVYYSNLTFNQVEKEMITLVKMIDDFFSQMKHLVEFNKNKWHFLVKMANGFPIKCNI